MQLFPRAPAGDAPLTLAVVAAGGAIGASLRWMLAETLGAADPATWEWATLVVNVVGSFAIGITARRFGPGAIAWSFTATGVLGGFTTFSTFAVVLNDLVDAGRPELAAAYGAVTLIAGVGATWLAGGSTRPREEFVDDGSHLERDVP